MEELYNLLELAASGNRFTQKDKDLAFPLFDGMYELLESRKNPPGFKLASGEVAKGATGRIALNAYFLLLGRKVLGQRYAKIDKRFAYWNMYLGYHIMRSNFGGWTEKGIYCCSTCTLSVFPLYCIDAFPDLDCQLLKNNVLNYYLNKKGGFKRNNSRKYADWAMRFA
jgi:hypothetical protein